MGRNKQIKRQHISWNSKLAEETYTRSCEVLRCELLPRKTPLISPPLTDRDFLQSASRDGYQTQPLTHTGGSGHLRSAQRQMRRLAEMKPDCRQQSAVCVEALETNLRRHRRTLAATRLTQTDNGGDVRCLPLSLPAGRNLPRQMCFDQAAVALRLCAGVGEENSTVISPPSVCWRLAEMIRAGDSSGLQTMRTS